MAGNLDARFLATLLVKVSQLSADELDRMVRSVRFAWLADWLHSYVVKEHADKETLRQKWMATDDDGAGFGAAGSVAARPGDSTSFAAGDDGRAARTRVHIAARSAADRGAAGSGK